jgi:hypothetical protein
MKFLHNLIVFFAISYVIGCAPAVKPQGRYGRVHAETMGEEFRFSQERSDFEYYLRTEGNVREYSKGMWAKVKDNILVNGFTDENLNLLNITYEFENNNRDIKNAILVKYKFDSLDLFIKTDLIINDTNLIRICSDTSILFDLEIKSVQVKSYLNHKGLLLGPPHLIDTLFSPKVLFTNTSNKNNNLYIKIDVARKDFYRIKMNDTIVIKNNHKLIWRKNVLKKISN